MLNNEKYVEYVSFVRYSHTTNQHKSPFLPITSLSLVTIESTMEASVS
jgi:hypothetical protein